MKELTIGIDIGGTNTKYGIVDRQGNVVFQGSISTAQYEEFKDYFAGLSKALREAIKAVPGAHKMMGVGVGAANGNYYKGTIERATNLKWKGIIPLADMIREEFDLPAIITNDANAAAVPARSHVPSRRIRRTLIGTAPCTRAIPRRRWRAPMNSPTVIR